MDTKLKIERLTNLSSSVQILSAYPGVCSAKKCGVSFSKYPSDDHDFEHFELTASSLINALFTDHSSLVPRSLHGTPHGRFTSGDASTIDSIF